MSRDAHATLNRPNLRGRLHPIVINVVAIMFGAAGGGAAATQLLQHWHVTSTHDANDHVVANHKMNNSYLVILVTRWHLIPSARPNVN